MKDRQRRLNYLSYLIDASTDAVVRIAKVSGLISVIMTMTLMVNLLAAYGVFITPVWAATWVVMVFLGVWFIAFLTQASWVAYMVHTDTDEIFSRIEGGHTTPPTPPTKTHVFLQRSKGHDLIGEIVSGVGGEKEKLT